MMIGHITLFGLAEIILTVVVLTFVEKVTPKALDAVPDKTAFKPLYILMAVLIVLTPLGLLQPVLPGVNGVLMKSLVW